MSGSHTYDLSNEMQRFRLIEKLKREFVEYMEKTGQRLDAVVRLHEEARTVDQNSRLWKMLGILESHRAPCEAKNGEPATAEGWHEHLRLKYGYIYGTRAIALPNGAGGFFLVETPNPQPTRKGAKGQMNKATHSEYMERILDELEAAGLLEQWQAVEQAA